jgi:hypothetical protein
VNRRFGAYEILFQLSSGGMGDVLLGRRRGPGSFEQLVAIKTIRPEYASSPAVRAMFLDEAAILARLANPSIATVHDFGEEGGTLYMVMEYVAGLPFRDAFGVHVPAVVVARALAEAARGVHAAHEARDHGGGLLGVVHRDLSPDNLLLGFDGHVKVIDFGIALVKNRQSPVTEFGTLKGKPPYMSPEQVKNEPMDRRSDVFSLGVVAWELVTGRGLFDGDSIYAIARAVEHQTIALPSQALGEPLPIGLDAAIMNALDRDLARRTPTAAAFAEQLEQVVHTSGDETLAAWAERALAPQRTEHRAWLASVVAGAPQPRVGRATGAVTALPPGALDAGSPLPRAQLGPLAKADTQLAFAASAQLPAIADDPPDGPGASTHLPAPTDADLDVPPRRRRALPVLLALGVLALVVGGGALLFGGHHDKPPADAALVVVAPAPDAAVVVPPAPDASEPSPSDAPEPSPPDAPEPPPPDAGDLTVHRPPPHVPPHHVAPPALPPDAPPPVVASTETGRLTIKHAAGGTFLNVSVDGRYVGDTPIYNRTFPAGHHHVTLVAPDSKAIVYETDIDLAANAKLTVSP